ncbi:hypothetical protein O0I10_000154 [Lichtheimia ornata]|uniref:Uncharacterized protein n=1 Tax=Lichtheimia ornata TaxID=688661 RepID=A0AAD7Y4V5_9FUNG|nr:uncharacterized protein O0I10_000154 [Lichtheimia ornata]KAJ8663879.1 hypothetical protein O0I10_000154 [Lichtheimia ornata]
MSPEARKANVDAKKYHQQRQSETAHSFDELEFDYPTVNERIDPENASWREYPKDQCQVLLAHDDVLPELPLKDHTPMKTKEASDKWIKEHANDASTKGSPYKFRRDGSADLVG